MSSVLNLGDVQMREGKSMRLVRISHQTSLFEDVVGKLEVVEEHVLEFKGMDGELDFEVLSTTRTDYTGSVSSIKAPEKLTWRKE